MILKIRRTPTSTLFPYTTLFRSDVWADTAYRSRKNEKFLASRLLRSQIHRKKPKGAPMPRHTAQDRKSTRLNSSHPSTSYAVFCLKKKRKTHVSSINTSSFWTST